MDSTSREIEALTFRKTGSLSIIDSMISTANLT